jgi:hypothetical protein
MNASGSHTKHVSLLSLVVAGHHGQKGSRLGQQAVCRLVAEQRLHRILQAKRLVENEWRLEIRKSLALVSARIGRERLKREYPLGSRDKGRLT